jgi:hypothetical protein
MFMLLLANRFRISTDFSKPSCSSVLLLFLILMGATTAVWELQADFVKPPEECTQISRRL